MQLETTTEDTTVSQPNGLDQDFSGNGTNLRLPTATQPDESFYWGAVVGTESPGVNEHVVYPDLSAMYPSILLTLNISPDTIVGTEDDLEESEYNESDCVWAYIDTRPVKRCENEEDWQQYKDSGYKAIRQYNSSGDLKTKYKNDPPQYERCYYLRPDVKKGFITELVEEFIEVKNEAKGTDLYAATKAIVNSIYGTLGWASEHNAFRLFDKRLAESVTLVGRKLLRYTMDFVVEYSHNEYDTDAYVTHFDTDGVGIALDVSGQDDALQIANDATEHLREIGYGEFLKDQCGYTDDILHNHCFEADVEYYARRIYNHSAKKRYSLWRHWDEGEDDDSIKITGFEAVRSDVADITVELQEHVFETILKNDLSDAKTEVYEYISNMMERVGDGDVPIEQLGVRGGIGQELEEYGSESRRPQPIYRASKMVNDHIEGEDLGEASKPMYWPIEAVVDDSLPSTYSSDTAEDGDLVDYIAAEDASNVEGLVRFDYSEIAEKQVRDRVEPIISNIDSWSWEELETGTTQTGIDQFM